MEQLLKQTKSRFFHAGQPTLITGAVQSCGWRRTQSTLYLAAGSGKKRSADLQSEP